ncbi:MAG TPA: hypothetical protein VGP26_21245 [Actinophytocola sp.]|jgi:hypothetical protein|nr:hypothetical protein [Actinophytocola sp.]
MKRLLASAVTGLIALALVTACGQRPDADAGAPAVTDTLTSAPLDAGLVTDRFGWVLSADAVLLTRDGGKTFQKTAVDVPAGSARAAYFTDATHGWVAALGGTGIAVARTADGGRSWTASTIPTKARIADLSVAFGDAKRGALVAREQTGGAFSVADLYATTDGGASWRAGTAPAAGRVAVDTAGRIWLAGGVFGNELYSSANSGGSWAKARLSLSDGGAPQAVSLPANGVVSVSVSEGDRSRVGLLTSTDNGVSWRETGAVRTATDTAVAPAVSVARDLSVAVADPAGGRLGRVAAADRSTAAATLKSVQGLPAGVSRIGMVGSAGWALASSGSCVGEKQDCVITHSLVATTDNGATWHELLRWVQKLA